MLEKLPRDTARFKYPRSSSLSHFDAQRTMAATSQNINRPAQLYALDDLPRKFRHQRLGHFVREGHLKSLPIQNVLGWGLSINDVALFIRAARRLDWALDVLCPTAEPPIRLLDCRIEQSAIDVVAKLWAKPDRAEELLHALQARLDQIGSSSNARCTHSLYLLYTTLSTEGRSYFMRQLCKSSPSSASSNHDTRLEALDAIVDAFQQAPSELLGGPLRNILCSCSLPTLVSFLSSLPAADLLNVSQAVWARLASHEPQLVKEWIAGNTSLTEALVRDTILPALFSDRTPGARTAALLTQGQQYFHDHYCTDQADDLDRIIARLLSCIGTGVSINKKNKSERQRHRDAALFLFKHHIASRDFKETRLHGWEYTNLAAQIMRWLLKRRSEGDLEAAAKGARLLHTSHSDTKRFCLPQVIRAFPISMRAFVYAHANWSFETWPGERYWEEFIAQSPDDIHIPCDVFGSLEQGKSSLLLSKIGFGQVQCDNYVSSVLRRSPKPADEPFALHRQAVYMLELLESRYLDQSQLSDSDKAALKRAGETVLTTILAAKGPSEQARTVIDDFDRRRASAGEVRGHFATTAFFTALATQDAALIEETFQRLLQKSLRDWAARRQSLESILRLRVVIDTFATLKPDAGNACLRALADFFARRTKEPDYTYSYSRDTERYRYESLASEVFLRRVQAFLDGAIATEDFGALLSIPWQVWQSLIKRRETEKRRSVSLSLPSRATSHLLAFGKWLDEVVTVNYDSSLLYLLPTVKQGSVTLALASFAPALAGRLMSRLMTSVSSQARQSTLDCLLSLCGGPQQALAILCDLWKSGKADLQHLVLETLKKRTSARQCERANANIALALDWNHVEENFLRELFDLGPSVGSKKLPADRVDKRRHDHSADAQDSKDDEGRTDDEGGTDDEDGTDDEGSTDDEDSTDDEAGRSPAGRGDYAQRNFWQRICLQRSAPVSVLSHAHSHLCEDLRSDEIVNLIQWGSLDPVELATSRDLTMRDLRVLVTSANPSVASDQALELLRDGESSSHHRVISLNPATFKKLRPAAAKKWMNSALKVVISDGSKAKVTTSKAVIEAAAACASFDLDERLEFGNQVVSSIKHIDVQKCFMGIVMDYFWRRGSTNVVTEYVSRWTASENEEVRSALLVTTSNVDFDMQTEDKLQYILDEVVGPLIANAWAQKQQAAFKALIDATKQEPWRNDLGDDMQAAISCWAAPCGLLNMLGRDNLRALLVLALQRNSSRAKTVVDCVTDGLSAQNDKKSICLMALLDIKKKVRQQSPMLESMYNWAIGSSIRQVLSMSSIEDVLIGLSDRGWNEGAQRWLEKLEEVGVSHLRDDKRSLSSVTQTIYILCVKVVSERANCAEAARGVMDRLIAEAKNGDEYGNLYTLQWLAVPVKGLAEAHAEASPSTEEQSEEILRLLRSLYDKLEGYIWAREYIDVYEPFGLASDQFGCTQMPESPSSPAIDMMGYVAKQGAEACKRDDQFGYFCLQQIIQWIKSDTDRDPYSELVRELMTGKLCDTQKCKRLLKMRIKFDATDGKWSIT